MKSPQEMQEGGLDPESNRGSLHRGLCWLWWEGMILLDPEVEVNQRTNKRDFPEEKDPDNSYCLQKELLADEQH